MARTQRDVRWNLAVLLLFWAAMGAATWLALPALRSSLTAAEPQIQHPFPANPSPPPPNIDEISRPLTPKQKEKLAKLNFQKTQHDADQLLKLAKSLKEDLDQSNSNILSVKVVRKANQIEKLAKKIKSEAVNN
jgi:hypothetical protein